MPNRNASGRFNRRLGLLGLYLILSLGPLAILTAVNVYSVRQAAVTQTKDNLTASAASLGVAIDAQMNGLGAVVHSYSTTPSLIAALGTGDPLAFNQAEIDQRLQSLVSDQADVVVAFVTDAEGTLRDSVPADAALVGQSYSNRDWYRGIVNGRSPYISAVYQTAYGTNPWVVAAAAPVLDASGQRIGILVAAFGLAPLENTLLSVGQGDHIRLIAIDQLDHEVADTEGTPTKLVLDPGKPIGATNDVTRPELSRGRSPVYFVYAEMPDLNWAVLAQIPASRALAGSNQAILFTLGLAALMALVILAGLVLLARTLAQGDRDSAALRADEGRLRTIFNYAGVGIMTISTDDVVLSANPAMEAMLGYPPGGLIGMRFQEFTHPDDRPLSTSFRARLDSSNSGPVSMEKRYVRADGSVFWGQVTATPVQGERGAAPFSVSMVQDIQERRDSTERLEKLNNDKSHFVSLVSHEFRNALTGIQGFSETIRDEDLTPEDVRDFANDINRDAKRLARMINDLLDLERMEAGRVEFERAPVDLGALAAEAVEAAQLTSPSHTLRLEAEPALPEVSADADKMTQVLVNLISNAIKYSPAGGEVLVSVQATTEGVRVRVQDHGLGIPEQELERVFERYHRLEGGRPRDIRGTGLGLAIVKQIVEAHGGRIDVESREGEGSTFTFVIPWPAS